VDEELKQESISPKKSNTALYSVTALVAILVITGAYYFNKKSSVSLPLESVKPVEVATTKPGPTSLKGQKFSDMAMFDNAVQIYPGAISKEAKAVMTGWELKTKVLQDGVVRADLIPVGSEAAEGDTAHTFMLKNGDKLYFVDLNPNDDNGTSDKNINDDLGIVVDASGVIQ
jgi:hypothetical protein